MPPTDPNAYGSSWYAATAVASRPRPPLSAETDVDVCVIGGGLAGLTAAREIARRGWSVLVLEAHRLAWNASGRNSGFVVPGFAADTEALIARVGPDHAGKLWALSETGVAYVRNAIAEAAMPGVELMNGGWLHVSKTGGAAMERETDRLASLGAAIEFWPAARVREQLRSPRYFDAVHHPGAFNIHPFNYALGLAALAEASGARIHEETAALQIDPVGVRKRIVTKDARVRAAHVVLAGNVHLGGLMPQFAATLLPTYGYVIVTAPLGPALHQVIRFAGSVSDSERADNHYRIVGDDRLLWSGRSTVWCGKPSRYVKTLLDDLARTYPALGKVRADYAFSGTLGTTVHRMPQIGEISPGLWLLSGFGGHGLNTTAMGGELIARAIVDGDRTLQLFEPFGMVWAGGPLGRAAHQVFYWSGRSRERVGGFLARHSHRRASDAPRPRALVRPALRPATLPTELPAPAPAAVKPAMPLAEARPAPVAAPLEMPAPLPPSESPVIAPEPPIVAQQDMPAPLPTEPFSPPEPLPSEAPEPVAPVEPEAIPAAEPEAIAVSEPEPIAPGEPEAIAAAEIEPITPAEPEAMAPADLEPTAEPEPIPPPDTTSPAPVTASGAPPVRQRRRRARRRRSAVPLPPEPTED